MGKARGRSIRKVCKRSSNGQHKPVTRIHKGIINNKAVVVCDKCGKRLGRWKSGRGI